VPLSISLEACSDRNSIATEAPMKKQMSHDDCAELSRHLLNPTALPAECKKFQDVMNFLKRRDSDTTHPTQYLS
jgi:hypothetical protein